MYRYTGVWSMGLMHGQGQYTYSDGSRYLGVISGHYSDNCVFVDTRGAGSTESPLERDS